LLFSAMPFHLLSFRDLAPSRVLTRVAAAMALTASLSGCSVLAVADAAVTVAATAVSVTATVVETTVDVAAAGVRAATSDDKDEKQEEEKKKEQEQRTWQAPEWPVNR
jgi:hypothetical protein